MLHWACGGGAGEGRLKVPGGEELGATASELGIRRGVVGCEAWSAGKADLATRHPVLKREFDGGVERLDPGHPPSDLS